MERPRRIFTPWREIFFFIGAIVSVGLTAIVAVILSTSYANLNDDVNDIEKMLIKLEQRLCDKINDLRDELLDRIEALENITSMGIFQRLIEKGQPNGYTPLDGNATVPAINLPPELMEEQGCWNAMTNTPLLTSGGCEPGNFYVVSVGGNTNLDGTNDWNVGDALVCTRQVFWKRIRSEMSLDDLTDVTITSPVLRDMLSFNGAMWANTPFVELNFPINFIFGPTNAIFPGGANGPMGYGTRLHNTVWLAIDFNPVPLTNVQYNCVIFGGGGPAFAFLTVFSFALPAALGGPISTAAGIYQAAVPQFQKDSFQLLHGSTLVDGLGNLVMAVREECFLGPPFGLYQHNEAVVIIRT